MRTNPFVLLIPIAVLVLGLACGGGSKSGPAISLTPGSVNIAGNDSISFSASATPVSWSVVQGTAGGTITSNGRYTAPNQAGQFQVKADSSSVGSATATVNVVFTTVYSQPSRLNHSVTLLADGRLLVAGGWFANANYSSACTLYDPVTNTATSTGYLKEGRESHAATLLADGRVWITGGSGSSTTLRTTEFYDPATGLFTSGPSLTLARTYHCATLLKDGRVLITGGVTSNTTDGVAVTAAELFDPTSGLVSSLSSTPAIGKGSHLATLLKDGRVLFSAGKPLEVFNPTTLGFSLLATTLPDPRYSHTATLLPDGQVLFVGGVDGSNQLISRVERFDPTMGTVVAVGPLQRPRSGHTTTVLSNGRVVIAGGTYYDGLSRNVSLVEYYDTQTMGMQLLGDTYYQRFGHVGVRLLDGGVLLVGGLGNPKGVVGGGNIYAELVHPF